MRTLTALGGNYPTSVIPSTLVLDRRQRVAAVFLRALLTEDLQPVIERVAAEQLGMGVVNYVSSVNKYYLAYQRERDGLEPRESVAAIKK